MPTAKRAAGPIGVAIACAALLGCGSPPKTHAPATPSPSQSSEGWATMSWEDRHDVMTFAVLPNMAQLFQRFEKKADPDLTCASCHGDDYEAVQFKMPHGLPALDRNEVLEGHTRETNKTRIWKFMVEEVTPAMADLLEVERYDPKTKRGFSCFNCHPAK
jgi:hypothetical protein